jgi:hypothetical protein
LFEGRSPVDECFAAHTAASPSSLCG